MQQIQRRSKLLAAAAWWHTHAHFSAIIRRTTNGMRAHESCMQSRHPRWCQFKRAVCVFDRDVTEYGKSLVTAFF